MKAPFSKCLSSLLENPPAWLTHRGDRNDVVIATIVQYKRNLRDFPFSGWAEKAQRAEVFSQISQVAGETEIFQKDVCAEMIADETEIFQRGVCAEMKELSLDARRLLIEWQIITPTLATRQDGCGVISSPHGNVNLLINDEEHFTLRVNSRGYQLRRTLKQAKATMKEMSAKLPFAYDERLGWLMSSPKEAGKGFRVSLILHLPGLVLADLMSQVMNAAQPLSYEIRPLYGEDTDASGNLYEVSGVCIGDEDEGKTVSRMEEVFETLIKRELSVRDKFLGTRFYEFLDPVERGVGTLHYAVRVGWREALNHLSYIRMGDTLDLVNWTVENRKLAAENLPLLMHTISSSFLTLHPDSEFSEKDDPEAARSFRIKQLLYPALPFGILPDND